MSLSASGKSRVMSRLSRRLVAAKKAGFKKAEAYRSLRPGSDIIIWMMSKDADAIADLKEETGLILGANASIVHGFLSTYEMSREVKEPTSSKFFIAYPMSKSPEWYLKTEEERKRIVAEHVKIAINSEYNDGIASYTTESFGIGDSEFVVIYELGNIWNWVRVTEQLRHARARSWITNESPILVGIKGKPGP